MRNFDFPSYRIRINRQITSNSPITGLKNFLGNKTSLVNFKKPTCDDVSSGVADFVIQRTAVNLQRSRFDDMILKGCLLNASLSFKVLPTFTDFINFFLSFSRFFGDHFVESLFDYVVLFCFAFSCKRKCLDTQLKKTRKRTHRAYFQVLQVLHSVFLGFVFLSISIRAFLYFYYILMNFLNLIN